MLMHERHTSELEHGANAAPTQPQQDVFKMLSDQLEEQLKKWAELKTNEVPKVSAVIKQLDLPALTVSQNAEAK